MATEYAVLKGKTKWFRPTILDPTYGKWSHDIYLDDASLAKFKELQALGVKNHLRKDDDGYYVKLSRPGAKQVRGRTVPFTPPKVVNKNGEPMDNPVVGNGSDITSWIEVYRYKAPNGNLSTAIRWTSTRVDNLVPFNPKQDFLSDEFKQVSGLLAEPPPDFN